MSWKKQTGIAKDQSKFFKDQMNAVNSNNTEDDIKKDDDVCNRWCGP